MAVTKTLTDVEDALVYGGSQGTVAFQLVGATWTGVVTFESTVNGTTWVATLAFPVGSGTGATTANADGIWRMNASALKSVRARLSTDTAGAVVVTAENSDTVL
jgi:hypothetical protein